MQNKRTDQRELDQFADVADHWWDPRGPMKMLHRINPERLAHIRTQLTPGNHDALPFDGLRILDLGCGAGLVTLPLARLGAEATGLDPTEKAIMAGMREAERQGLEVTFLHQTSDQLAADGAQFDHAVCLEMLEHVPDPSLILSDLFALLKPGGRAVLSTLNRTPKSFAGAIVVAEHLGRFVPRGTHQWRKFIKPKELASMAEQAGFQIMGQTGLSFDFLRGVFFLSDDLSVNYFMTVEKPA
jgi:ubiquinone biosynthesis O-methyltransferase